MRNEVLQGRCYCCRVTTKARWSKDQRAFSFEICSSVQMKVCGFYPATLAVRYRHREGCCQLRSLCS